METVQVILIMASFVYISIMLTVVFASDYQGLKEFLSSSERGQNTIGNLLWNSQNTIGIFLLNTQNFVCSTRFIFFLFLSAYALNS